MILKKKLNTNTKTIIRTMMKKVKRRSREEVASPDIQGWAQFPMQDEERKI